MRRQRLAVGVSPWKEIVSEVSRVGGDSSGRAEKCGFAWIQVSRNLMTAAAIDRQIAPR